MQGGELLLAALSGAFIVLSGALYALLFALGKLGKSRLLIRAAYLAYAVLVLCSLLLARVLRLEGSWMLVIIAMLIGYLLAPAAIWRLCVGTHGEMASGPSLSDKGAN